MILVGAFEFEFASVREVALFRIRKFGCNNLLGWLDCMFTGG